MPYLGIIYTWVSVAWMWNLNGNLHSEIMKTEVIFYVSSTTKKNFPQKTYKDII